jgi:hypothetical protein
MGFNHTNLTGLEKSKWGTQFNHAGIQHQTLNQYTGTFNYKLKNGTPYKAKLVCLYNELFWKLLKIVIKYATIFTCLKKQIDRRTLDTVCGMYYNEIIRK